MAGRQCGGSSGGSRVGGALAAAAVGGALAAGAVGSANTHRTEQVTAEQTHSCTQTQAQEDMPMCRHVNLISTAVGCCSVDRQLWELNQVLDYQNKILVELLQAVREQRRGEQ